MTSLRRALVGLMLTHDPSRAVLAVTAVLVVPLRLWTLAGNDAANPIYRLYPWWLQVVTLAVFVWIWCAAMCLSRETLRRAAAAGFVLSVTVAAVQGVASFASGAWVWWLAMAACQGWALFRLAAVPVETEVAPWTYPR